MYLYQDLNRRPSTIDGYRTAIIDTLGPAGHHIAQSSDLHRLLSSFQVSPGIVQKAPEILQNGPFLLFSMSSQKHPSQANKIYFDHGLPWMSMDVQGHRSMDVHGYPCFVKWHHGQRPWIY